jgi:hypothetical protein
MIIVCSGDVIEGPIGTLLKLLGLNDDDDGDTGFNWNPVVESVELFLTLNLKTNEPLGKQISESSIN